MEEIMLPSAWLPIIAFLIPLAVSFLTKPEASNGWRAALSIALSGLIAVLELVVAGGLFTVARLISAFFTAAATSVVSYAGVWKHGDINKKIAPNVGVELGKVESQTLSQFEDELHAEFEDLNQWLDSHLRQSERLTPRSEAPLNS